ncbi:hypothetical protein TNCV_4875831 [Trichonephila clavipes]|nr:hypothetical protein TNCV_4875831 [Trichonephila clavipes]
MPPNRWCQIEGIDNHHRKSVVSHNLVHHAGYSTLLFRLIPIFRKNTLGLPLSSTSREDFKLDEYGRRISSTLRRGTYLTHNY